MGRVTRRNVRRRVVVQSEKISPFHDEAHLAEVNAYMGVKLPPGTPVRFQVGDGPHGPVYVTGTVPKGKP